MIQRKIHTDERLDCLPRQMMQRPVTSTERRASEIARSAVLEILG